MDTLTLYGPGGASPIQLGSYILADPGIDFGEKGHLEPHLNETAAVPGGAFAFQQTRARKWTIPLLVGSGGAIGLSRDQIESLIRLNAVTGGYVDFTPGNVASQAPIRFDVLAGQWEPDYKVRVNELARRQGNLMLQTQPYGYWPTWITLGSAASIGAPGFLPISGGSVFGDAPGFGEVIFSPTAFGSQYTAASMYPDVLLWSMRTQASFQPFLNAASWTPDIGLASTGVYGASLGGPGATGITFPNQPYPYVAAWQREMYYTIGQPLEPAYRGRYKAFAFARTTNVSGQQLGPWLLSLDAVSDANGGAPLGSSAVVATVAPALIASGAHQLISLGPVTLPPVASGLPQAVRLRLWALPDVLSLGGSNKLEFSGLYLMPADAPAGVMTKGLAVPTAAIGSTGRLALDSYERSVFVGAPTGTLDQRLPVSPAPNYRGALPIVGASALGVDILAMGRLAGYGWGYRSEVMNDFPDHFYSFQASSFPTMIDYVGQLSGSWGPLGGVLGQVATGIRVGYDDGGVYASSPQSHPTGQGYLPIASALTPFGQQLYWASQWAVEFWINTGFGGGAGSGALIANGAGPSVATDAGWFITWNQAGGLGSGPSVGLIFDLGADPLPAMGLLNKTPYHVVAQWYAPSKAMSLFVNGTLAASKVAVGSYKAALAATGIGVLGWNGSAVGGYNGAFDDLAIYGTTLTASRIAAHYAAGASGILSTATDTVLYQPMAAQATLRYRPAFNFLKGL